MNTLRSTVLAGTEGRALRRVSAAGNHGTADTPAHLAGGVSRAGSDVSSTPLAVRRDPLVVLGVEGNDGGRSPS